MHEQCSEVRPNADFAPKLLRALILAFVGQIWNWTLFDTFAVSVVSDEKIRVLTIQLTCHNMGGHTAHFEHSNDFVQTDMATCRVPTVAGKPRTQHAALLTCAMLRFETETGQRRRCT